MYVHFQIPELKIESMSFSMFWLKSLFGGGISSNFEVNSLAILFVRLTDAAVFEYSSGRDAFLTFWNTNRDRVNLGAMHRASSCFENCLSNAHRATLAFSRLRNHPSGDPLSKVLQSYRPEFIRESYAGKLRAMRNEVHHTESSLMKGRLGAQVPILLKPDGIETAHPTEVGQTDKTFDRLVIGQHQMLLSDIAAALEEMADYCRIIGEAPSATTGVPAS
ncbi:hypothetical protein [Lysobacter enzymogenes]|uniref:hypothetical protein n=1 Tax=Lysobacter enzymogenes TaxID=69 RepID=UPI001AF7BACF|nr:hypothetical protein [Lysobacter enzymogenes]QQQ00813.1 hypothetical protein JHW41_22555 [Lysobacter enzymogenes]